jgi:hypothetical protein
MILVPFALRKNLFCVVHLFLECLVTKYVWSTPAFIFGISVRPSSFSQFGGGWMDPLTRETGSHGWFGCSLLGHLVFALRGKGLKRLLRLSVWFVLCWYIGQGFRSKRSWLGWNMGRQLWSQWLYTFSNKSSRREMNRTRSSRLEWFSSLLERNTLLACVP